MNQHASRKRELMWLLGVARACLASGAVMAARIWLAEFHRRHALAPASTRRRWRCGM